MPRKTSAVKDWANYEFSTGCYPGDDYLKFQRVARSELRKIVQLAGYKLHKFYPEHYEFSAVLKNEADGRFVYVSILDVRSFAGRWYNEVLYHSMEHDKDWRGGPNRWCRWDELSDALVRFAAEQASI